MPLNFNGNIPDVITFNGKDVKKVEYIYRDEVGILSIEVWTKNTEPETWVLHDTLSDTIHDTCNFNCQFSSDGIVFESIKVEVSGQKFTLKYDDITACTVNTNEWSSEEYKTIKLAEAAHGQLKQWLLINATKQ